MISRSLFVEEKKLRVFDFDDTLVKTDSYIYVTDKSGRERKLTPGEYAIYKPRPGDAFDYRDFSEVKNPKQIKAITKILRDVARAGGKRGVYILTARAAAKPIERYIKDIGIRNVKVVALGSSNPQDKADWIKDKVDNEDYDDVYFIDDSLDNVKTVKRSLKDTGIKHRVSLMKSKWEN